MILSVKSFPAKAAFVIANLKSKLLDQVREVLRVKHYSLRTEGSYVQWARRFLKFHRDRAGVWKHPRKLGATEVVAFLNHRPRLDTGLHATTGDAAAAGLALWGLFMRLKSGVAMTCLYWGLWGPK